MAQGFKTAFATARKAGKKEFTWNGKSYNTELAETVRPKARGTKAAAKAQAAGTPTAYTKVKSKPKDEVTKLKARPTTAVAKAAAKSPGGYLPDMAAIKAGNQAQREARREARAARRNASKEVK